MRRAWLLVVVACGSAPPKSIAHHQACKTVVHIPWLAPVVGETLEWDAIGDVSGVSAKGETVADHSELATTERVIDATTPTAEITFKKSSSSSKQVSMGLLSGNTYRMTARGRREDWSRAGGELDQALFQALDRYSRHDLGRPHWLLSLLLERTFVVGEETHLTEDSALLWDRVPADVRITLQRVESGVATFDLAFRAVGTLPATLHATASVDIAHGRLRAYSIDGSTARLTVKATEHFQYAGGPSQPPPHRDGCATTLRVPWIAPQVGETVDAETTLSANGPQGNMLSVFAVRSKVLEVTGDVATAVELTHGRSMFNGVDKPADPAVVIVRGTRDQHTATRDGVELDAAETRKVLANASFLDDVGTRMGLARLVTDRTFEVGVESHFPQEHVRTLPDGDLRITLVSIEGSTAKFTMTLAVKPPADAPATVKLPPWRGVLELDTKRGRVTRYVLEIEGSGMKGSTSVRFTYAP